MTKRQVLVRFLWIIVVFVIVLLPCSAPFPPWQVYTLREGSFVLHPASLPPASFSPPPLGPLFSRLPSHPVTWHLSANALADVTCDGTPEWLLLVWRPWRDWPIQRWSPVPSPIAGFHDAAGDEVVTLEGDYAAGRAGPATHVDVWRWNGFGFVLDYRSPPGTFRQLRLTDGNDDGTLDILIR